MNRDGIIKVLERATAVPAEAVYTDVESVPRDLRTSEQLATGGYGVLGPVLAWLEIPSDVQPTEREERKTAAQGAAVRRVALHSTSEARRLRGFGWAWPSRETQSRHRSSVSEISTAVVAESKTTKAAVHHTPLLPKRSTRPSLGADPRRWLSELFREDFVVIDTETTGLSARDEVIEIAAVAADGELLYETLVRPKRGFVPAASTKIHGLKFADVEHGPSWPEAVEELLKAISGKRLLAWNAPFDMRLCVQSSRAWGVGHALPGFECAMRAYAACRATSNGSFRLERAAIVEGVMVAGQSHRSADDARLVVSVLRRLQNRPKIA